MTEVPGIDGFTLEVLLKGVANQHTACPTVDLRSLRNNDRERKQRSKTHHGAFLL